MWFLDIFGAHRFYLGDYGRAVGMFLTLVGFLFGLWSTLSSYHLR
ncbi:MAG TPA: NINE protein [Dehalococcoidia bacterium]|nr:NINE protein [Dehalococcoidia bacterium]